MLASLPQGNDSPALFGLPLVELADGDFAELPHGADRRRDDRVIASFHPEFDQPADDIGHRRLSREDCSHAYPSQHAEPRDSTGTGENADNGNIAQDALFSVGLTTRTPAHFERRAAENRAHWSALESEAA